MSEAQIFAILVAVAVVGTFLVLRLERKPIVELQPVKSRPSPHVSSGYVRQAIRSGLAKRQMSREEIIKNSYIEPEDTVLILDLMLKAGEIAASDDTDNPHYVLVFTNGTDAV